MHLCYVRDIAVVQMCIVIASCAALKCNSSLKSWKHSGLKASREVRCLFPERSSRIRPAWWQAIYTSSHFSQCQAYLNLQDIEIVQ